jgi:hypothetical protein
MSAFERRNVTAGGCLWPILPIEPLRFDTEKPTSNFLDSTAATRHGQDLPKAPIEHADIERFRTGTPFAVFIYTVNGA